jgi:hypothetical protein
MGEERVEISTIFRGPNVLAALLIPDATHGRYIKDILRIISTRVHKRRGIREYLNVLAGIVSEKDCFSGVSVSWGSWLPYHYTNENILPPDDCNSEVTLAAIDDISLSWTDVTSSVQYNDLVALENRRCWLYTPHDVRGSSGM